MLLNCSSAAWRFSAVSFAITSGAGRFSVSSKLSSLSQKKPNASEITKPFTEKTKKKCATGLSYRGTHQTHPDYTNT